ncbi:undecaprenyl-diphosphate phosphatase [Orbus sasakiae]|uniref:undecaprenyl-diphosphate phosphatase n=1 Tax=Orbus sasakiae TaxID=1078475 RepID=A0ABP9N9V3_9GAMM
MLTQINTQLFLLLNAAPDASKFTINFALFCAQYLIYLPIIIGVYCGFKKPTTRQLLAKIALIVMATLILTVLLRAFVSSPRPFDLAIGTNYLPHTSSNSLPSKHAAFIFAITFALLSSVKQQLTKQYLAIGCLSIALLISWARIYLGVHWPLDILAAIVISAVCAYTIDQYWPNLKAIFKTRLPNLKLFNHQ